MKYYFIDKVTFDSLYALITFYQSNPLKSLDFTVKLQVKQKLFLSFFFEIRIPFLIYSLLKEQFN